jgi:putative zinc finger protein
MRPEPNNEIDLLLRQLSRRNGSPVSENEEPHLDADELNSYVANALPPPARARYTEHLADCSSCRKLVAQLSAAQGPAPVAQSGSVVASSGFMSFLASLFSPMVLRYAVPALGLIVIAAVGIFVFRQNERQGSIAGLTDTQQKAVNQPQPAEPASPQAYYDNNTEAKNDTGHAQKDATRPAAGDVAPVTKEAPALAKSAVDAAGSAAAEPPPPAPKAGKVDAEDDRPEDVDKLKLKKDAAEKQAAVREANKEREEANKNEPAKAETSTVTVTQGETARRDVTVRSAKSAEPMTRGNDLKRAPAAAARTGSGTGQADSRSREQSNEQAKPTDTLANAETRSVAGRRFRKTGNVWTDTGYDSSSAVTVVKRGSEQYRALIADEPSIREIAEQLDGEILLVWKGRTYRIR